MDMIDKFFEEFPDRQSSVAVWGSVLLLLFIIIAGIYSNFRTDDQVTFACIIYLFMALAALIIFLIDNQLEHNKVASCILSGDHDAMGLLVMGAGILFGLVMVFQKQTIGIPAFELTGGQAFQFVVIIAPIVEEMFFRWTLFPTLRQFFLQIGIPGASISSMTVVSLGFGLYHFYVYGAALGAVWIAVAFSFVYIIGNYLFKSGNFSLGAHFMNNLLLFN